MPLAPSLLFRSATREAKGWRFMEDLSQEGCLILTIAEDWFRPELGFALSIDFGFRLCETVETVRESTRPTCIPDKVGREDPRPFEERSRSDSRFSRWPPGWA